MDNIDIYAQISEAIEYYNLNINIRHKTLPSGWQKDTWIASIGSDFEDVIRTGWMRRGNGGLMLYNGYRYDTLPTNFLHIIVKEILKRHKVDFKIVMLHSHQIVKHIETSMIKSFTPNRSIVAFRNGVLLLDSMEFYPHDERFETNIYLDFDFDPTAECDNFLTFLSEILPEMEIRMILQEFMGLMFIDRKKINPEKMLLLVGAGSNGKSVFINTIQNLIGAENYTAFELSQLCQEGLNTVEYNTASANGKLINLCSDMGTKDFSGGRFKKIVSYETVQGRQIGQMPFQATDMPLLVASVNSIPITTDHSYGHWRRHVIVPFNVIIPPHKQDRSLSYKLKDELPGIFRWILLGRERLIEQKGEFTQSATVNAMNQQIKVESNSLLLFLQDRAYLPRPYGNAELKEIPAKELYADYARFCLENGYKSKGNRMIHAELQQMGVIRERRNYGFVLNLYIGSGEDRDTAQYTIPEEAPAYTPPSGTITEIPMYGDNEYVDDGDLPF